MSSPINSKEISEKFPEEPLIRTTSSGIIRARYITCDQPCLKTSDLNLKESDVNVNWQKLQIINPIRLAYKLAEILNEDLPEINLQSNYIIFKDIIITLYLTDSLRSKVQLDRKKLLCDLLLKQIYPNEHEILSEFKKFKFNSPTAINNLYTVTFNKKAYKERKRKRLENIEKEISKKRLEIENNESYSEYFKASKIEKLKSKKEMLKSVEYERLCYQEKLNWITVLNHTCMVNDLRSYYDTYRGYRDGSRELINNRLKQKKKGGTDTTSVQGEEEDQDEINTNEPATTSSRRGSGISENIPEKIVKSEICEIILKKCHSPVKEARSGEVIGPDKTTVIKETPKVQNVQNVQNGVLTNSNQSPNDFTKTIVQIKLAIKPENKPEKTLFILEHFKEMHEVEELKKLNLLDKKSASTSCSPSATAKKLSEVRAKLVSETRSETAKFALMKLVADGYITGDKVVSELIGEWFGSDFV